MKRVNLKSSLKPTTHFRFCRSCCSAINPVPPTCRPLKNYIDVNTCNTRHWIYFFFFFSCSPHRVTAEWRANGSSNHAGRWCVRLPVPGTYWLLTFWNTRVTESTLSRRARLIKHFLHDQSSHDMPRSLVQILACTAPCQLAARRALLPRTNKPRNPGFVYCS
jgi:hypothetical protein